MNHPRRKIGIILGIFVVIASFVVILLFQYSPDSSSQMDELRISSGSSELSLLTLVAQEKRIFQKHHLNVTYTAEPSGVESVESLFTDTADVAYAAEFVGVSQLLKGSQLVILGSSAKSELISLIIRKDRSITTPADLRKKTLGVPKGTQAEFFLGRYLSIHGITLSDVTIIFLPPGNLLDCIATGVCDGAVVWEPYVYEIQQKLPGQVDIWPAQSGQIFYWTSYVRPDILEYQYPRILRYFAALSETEKYFIHNEQEVKSFVKRKLNLSDDYVDLIWSKNQYIQSFDQGLLLAMEDEARWLIKNNLSPAKRVPVFLQNMNTSLLKQVDPKAVQLITG